MIKNYAVYIPPRKISNKKWLGLEELAKNLFS